MVAPTGHGKAAALEVLHDAGAVAAGQVDAVRGRVPMNAVAAEGDDEAAFFRLVREEGDEFVAAVGVGFEGIDENRGRAEAADFGLAAFAVDDAVGDAVGMIDVRIDAAGPGDAVGRGGVAEGVLKAVAAGLVVGEIPHAVAVLAVVPVDGAPEVDARLFPGVVGGEDGAGLDAVGALDEAGEAAAIGDFVVVDEEVEVGVVHGGGSGNSGGFTRFGGL